MRFATTIAALASAVAAFAQTTILAPTQISSDSPYQFRYASNLNIGDSVVNISNSGASGGTFCVNVYVYDPSENFVSCCSCSVTPNAVVSYSARGDLISNPLSGNPPTSIVIKLLATVPVGGSCSNSAQAVAAGLNGRGGVPTVVLASGMGAWGTSLHALTTAPGAYAMTETEFKPQPLSTYELNRLGTQCSQAVAQGSGAGICNFCRLGGL